VAAIAITTAAGERQASRAPSQLSLRFELNHDDFHSHIVALDSVAHDSFADEILQLVADGLSTRHIATALAISPWAVAAHIRHVFAKLGVTTRAQAAAVATLEGLTPR